MSSNEKMIFNTGKGEYSEKEILKFWNDLVIEKRKEGQSKDDFMKELKQQIISMLKKYKMLEKTTSDEEYDIIADYFLNYVGFEEDQDIGSDVTEEIRTIIKENVEKYKSLQEIELMIAEKFSAILSSSDRAYVERKFVTYCLESYMTEAVDSVKKLVNAKNFDNVQKLITSLNKTENFLQIPQELKGNFYELLMAHKKFIRNNIENDFLSQMKSACFEEVSNFSDVVSQEVSLMEKFIEFLNYEKNYQIIINDLQLNELCQGLITFNQFFKNIIESKGYTGDTITAIKSLAGILQTKENLLMVDTFKQIICPYTKPPLVKEITIDGRNVLQVIGKIINLTEVVKDVENQLLKNKKIEEIHFIATVFYVDEELRATIWHGMNIVVYAKIVRVTRQITWNVSGSSNDQRLPKANDSQRSGEDGAKGEDGVAGESGGNVLIISDSIEQLDNLYIESSGGHGGTGQSGGNGTNGGDGKGMEVWKFDEQYPPAANTVAYKSDSNHALTLENIDSNVDYFDINFRNDYTINLNTFIVATSREGYKITYCISSSSATFFRTAFVLVKGSTGKPGTRGGEAGLGGEGGYAGEIVVNNKKFGVSRNGKNGSNGKGGLSGSYGKNGWDIGYVDNMWWGAPVMYGRDQASKLELSYSSYKSGRVWSSYMGNYAIIKYMGRPDTKITHYEERTSNRNVNDRKVQAKAERKKALTRQSIVSMYSHQFEISWQIKSDLIKTKKSALEAILEKKYQQEKQNIELVIKYQTNFINKSKHYHRKEITTGKDLDKTKKDIEIRIDGLIGKISKNPMVLETWNELKTVQLQNSQCNQVISIFGNLNQNINAKEDNFFQQLQFIITEKYRINIFRSITNKLPVYFDVKEEMEIISGNLDRQLIEADQNYKNVSHNVLGLLRPYFYENGIEERQKISRFYSDSIRVQENIDILKTTIKAFVLGAGKSANIHIAIKNYYQDFQEFLKQRKSEISKHFEEFRTEISKPIYSDILMLWPKSLHNKSLEIAFRVEMEKYPELKQLYEKFNEQLQEKYNWEICCKDEVVLKEYSDYIQRKGTLSESCRELLAYAYDININIYVKNKADNYSLLDSHNPKARIKLHILCINNKFIEIKFDEDYLIMEKDRMKRNQLYASIFTDIDSLKTIKALEEYCTKKVFLSNEHKFNEELYQTYLDYCRMDEIEDINTIVQYFSTLEDKQNVKNCLEMITSQYIGQHGILHHLSNRFENEGIHISYEELYYFVNSILKSALISDHELNLYCWIVAAYSQENWICELILLQLENVFRKPLPDKNKWRQNLTEIKDMNILLLLYVKIDQLRSNDNISIEIIGNILHLLSNIPKEIYDLDKLDITEWLYALKENYWKYKLNLLTKWTKEKLEVASYYVLTLENNTGNVLVDTFIDVLDKKDKLDENGYFNILLRFQNEEWSLNKITLNMLETNTISEWIDKMQADKPSVSKDRNVTQLIKFINGNGNTSDRIQDILPSIEKYILAIKSPEYKYNNRKVYEFTEDDIKEWAINFRENFNGTENIIEMYYYMFAVINRGIQLIKGFKLRDTQSLSTMVLLQNKHSTLLQMLTGEGKTLIIVAATIIKVLCGEKVDIVTSSSVLAKRDAESNKSIYDLFGVKVSHNCSEDIEKRKEAYANNDVVYGDLSNFQRDFLLDRFYKENVLSNHKFENIFIDEVDSLLLDKGNNVLYLSRDIPGLDKLESVYIFIWRWISRPTANKDELSNILDTNVIKEAVISELYGLITKDDIKNLDTKLTEQKVYKIWNILIDAKIIDVEGKLLNEKINYYEVKNLFSTEFSIYDDRIKFMLRECAERERFIKVPNYFKSFVLEHLDNWIESAKSAMFMQERSDYIIDVDRSGTSSDIYPNVIILDKDTGTDQVNVQWDEALHQFLQLKHGCKLSLQSLKAVFISNVTFFKLYSKMYGLTGTLGSQRERDLLKEIHKIDFINIPTTKPKLFDEKSPVFCSGLNDWKNGVYNESLKMINIQRSVLVICETVNDVEMLYRYFKQNKVNNIHKYTRDYEVLDITKGEKKLDPGHIIIATNLAGRGTDIKITKSLNDAGGLHVILAYLPNNIRIEHQAFGRAARAGNKGSGQLVIMGPSDKGFDSLKVMDLKKERDVEELRNLADIKEYYNTQIRTEEYCFKEFTNEYEKWKSYFKYNRVSSDMTEVLLNSCLDRWSFWLDRNSFSIKTLKGEQLDLKIKESLAIFISELSKPIKENNNEWYLWVHGPFQTIKLAKCYIEEGIIDKGISLLNQVIQDEKYYSELAHYYKAFGIGKKINWESKPLKDYDEKLFKELKRELEEAGNLFDEHSNFSIMVGSIIDMLKQYNATGIIQPEAYKKQKENLSNLYSIFSKSIDTVLGSFITPKSFLDVDINEEIAGILFNDLLKKNILTKPTINAEISEETLRKIASDYGVSVNDIISFLSKYTNQSIEEIELKDKIKEYINLPGRESFWEILKEKNVLYNEVVYVCIDENKMKNVDSSLLNVINEKINNGEIKKVVFDKNEKSSIYLYPEHIESQNNVIILEKNNMKEHISENKFQVLEKRQLITLNKKASFKVVSSDIISFPHFDSITLEDFSKVKITKSEAKQILKYLVKNNILKTINNNEYKLANSFEKINEIELLDFPVYENVVKTLLYICFTYRIAFEKTKQQYEEKKVLINLNLMTEPYQSLVFDMMDKKILNPTKVSAVYKSEDMAITIKSMYENKFSADEIIFIFKDSQLFSNEITHEFIQHLIDKEWLLNGNSNILKIITDKRKPLSNAYKNIEETAKIVLDNYFILTKDDIVKKIEKKLNQYSTFFNILEVPVFILKPMTEYFDERSFGNIDEVRLFTLNGLDKVITLEEKRWTLKMILNTVAVVLMGIAQITMGAVIEIFSVGIMTYVAGVIISEGIGDLIYAAGAFKSGYFDWKDYGLYKAKSFAISLLTVGVGAWISRGVSLSRYGYKIAGPTFSIGGKELAKQSGKELIENVGLKVIGKQVAQRIVKKTTEGLTIALANTGVDIIIENYVQSFCDTIGTEFLTSVFESIDKHKINKTLDDVFDKLGEKLANEMIHDITETYINENNQLEGMSSLFFKIGDAVLNGIKSASKKISKANSEFNAPLKIMEKVLDWTERFEHINKVQRFIDDFLDTLDEKIVKKLQSVENIYHQKEEESIKNLFKKNVIDNWKKILGEKMGQSISNDIVAPILRESTSMLVARLGKQLQKKYKELKEQKNITEFGKLKQTYQEKLLEIKTRKEQNLQVENHVTNEYHKNLLKLLSKTKNSNLFSAIARENVPMDLTCVNACAFVVKEILKTQGAENSEVSIIVHGEDGVSQKFSTSQDEKKTTVIELQLKNNHFQLHDVEEDGSTSPKPGLLKNNCLYEALPEGIRTKMSAKNFRNKVAYFVQNNDQVKFIINMGWHRFPLEVGVWGGGKDDKGKIRQVVPKSICDEYPLKVEIENTKKYQHGDWKFNKETDMDLRVNEADDVNIMKQFTDGCKFALDKINEEIRRENPEIAIDIKEFKVTMFDTVIFDSKLENFPVEIQTQIPLKIEKNIYNYTITIDCDNPIIEKDLNGPHGPHIGYKISGPKRSPWKGILGHILLNENAKLPDRHRGKKQTEEPLNINPEDWIDYSHWESGDIVERYYTSKKNE